MALYTDYADGMIVYGSSMNAITKLVNLLDASYYHFNKGNASTAKYGTAGLNIATNAGANVMTFTNDGSVGIGTTAPGEYKLKINGKAAATDFYSTSDIRYKDVLDTLEPSVGAIAKLPIFDYTLKEDEEKIVKTGTSAQDVSAIFPNLVTGTERLTLNYAALGAVEGIAVARELVLQLKEIEQLKTRISELEEIVNKLSK